MTQKDYKLFNYGNYSSGNYGAKSMAVKINNKTYYYSYETLVAFEGVKNSKYYKVVMKNYWSNTTGKHLNFIDGGQKDKRVDEETFNKLLNEFENE